MAFTHTQVRQLKAKLDPEHIKTRQEGGVTLHYIEGWHAIVSAVTDPVTRGDCALAVVFANAVGTRPKWEKLVEKLTFIEAPIVTEWKQQSEDKGVLKGKIESLGVLLSRYGEVPAELLEKIQASKNPAELDAWILKAAKAKTLASFRKQTKL